MSVDTSATENDETTTRTKSSKESKAAKAAKAAASAKPEKGSSKAKAGKGGGSPIKKKTPEEKEETRRSAAASLGAALKPLLGEVKKAKSAISTLIKGERPDNESMIALRDLIKLEAASAREADDSKRATALSNANRLVRRIERETRA